MTLIYADIPKDFATTVIVLGLGVTDHKTPPKEGKQRLNIAIELMKEGFAKKVVVCGSDTNEDAQYTEAEAMRDYLVAHSIPEENILLDIESRDTIGNAIFAKRLCKKQHRFFLVTSDYHMRRSLYCFNHIFGPKARFFPLTSETKFGAEKREVEKSLLELTKLFFMNVPVGDDQKAEDLLLANHPGYAQFR